MRDTVIVRNPDWSDEQIAKARRGDLTPSCHDGSDHLGYVCAGGHENHLHRTQVEPLPRGVEIAARCQTCGRVMVIVREEVLAAMDEAWGRA